MIKTNTMKARHNIGRMNRYYKLTNFYYFLKQTVLKGVLAFLGLLAVFYLLNYFFFDIEHLLNLFVENYSKPLVFSVFLFSETFFGLLAPDIFIAWCAKLPDPWWLLLILASLSYLGGVFSYLIGHQLYRVPSIHRYVHGRVAGHLKNIRKWGGLFVVIGALLPIPHSIISMACGLIEYKFSHYLLWALFRFLRFYFNALLLFNLLSI